MNPLALGSSHPPVLDEFAVGSCLGVLARQIELQRHTGVTVQTLLLTRLLIRHIQSHQDAGIQLLRGKFVANEGQPEVRQALWPALPTRPTRNGNVSHK